MIITNQKMYRKTLFLLIVLVAFLCFFPGNSLAERADILRFEPRLKKAMLYHLTLRRTCVLQGAPVIAEAFGLFRKWSLQNIRGAVHA